MERVFIFLRSPAAATSVLLGATVIALILANSPSSEQYFGIVNHHLGPLSIMEWVNDALMAIFFLFVGLEVKRELIAGELNTNAKRVMPGIAALFGVLTPALIYFLIAGHSDEYIHGWAIPTATDIAFSIGIITALGSRVPNAMKVFLTALAVIDDLIAIIVIAIFYAASIHAMYLLAAVVIVAALIYCNKAGYVRPLPYIILGFILWYCVLKSGLHATMAGVILAMTIPAHGKVGHMVVRPMQHWEHVLSNWVSFLIVPVFAFFNAGVDLRDVSLGDLTHPVVLGVALGLILGKQIGIFGAVFGMVKLGLVPMPTDSNWKHVYGTAIVCGIGFTMSIFVSILAFDPGHAQEMAKGGVILGSIISALLGYVFLRIVGANRKECHIGLYHNC
ncbi:Na+/H+ antiporter NhaA [Veillonella denticariosi]|uniref:Na+/H+ antiporter NhaA n=1 Tax=Veillonella denticariosi TaxID=419208 RepID=UPI002492D5AF|nr:Na+/H+ antiporter NhaA [Veillonella denticariosi]